MIQQITDRELKNPTELIRIGHLLYIYTIIRECVILKFKNKALFA